MLGRVGAGVVRRGEGTLASPSAVELASTSLGLSQVSSPSVGAREVERGRRAFMVARRASQSGLVPTAMSASPERAAEPF